MIFPRGARVAFFHVLCLTALAAQLRGQTSEARGQKSEARSPAADVSGPPSALGPPSSGQSEYILQPRDLVKVEVFQEQDMERQVRLTQDSTITLPLIGTVNLQGKTIQQAQDLIRQLYDRDYLVNPQINVIVLEYAKHDVKVLGQVDKAGAVEIPSDKPLKLLDAIALAGGFTRLADRKHVTLTRTNDDGKPTTTEINADDIIQSKNSSDAWILKEGDVIFVPERIL